MTNKQHLIREIPYVGKKKKPCERKMISPSSSKSNAIRINHIKAIIDKTQQNIKCTLCGNRDETVNHIISECSKLPKEYKTRHDWGGQGDPLGDKQETQI